MVGVRAETHSSDDNILDCQPGTNTSVDAKRASSDCQTAKMRPTATARPIIGRHRSGDFARRRAEELGISRATWFRRVKLGLIEKPVPPPNAAAREAAARLRREERQRESRRAANAADQNWFARWLETLNITPPTPLESHGTDGRP